MQSTNRTFLPLEESLATLYADTLNEPDPAGSTFERLLRTGEYHAQAEASALEQYERLAQDSNDPAIALVMRLILDDELRHHGLLERIATSLRDALYWTHSADALPNDSAPWTPVSAQLAAEARSLIKEEQNGARAMRDLAAKEKGIGGGLGSLLLEMMALDSEKHARLLEFVERRMRQRARTKEV